MESRKMEPRESLLEYNLRKEITERSFLISARNLPKFVDITQGRQQHTVPDRGAICKMALNEWLGAQDKFYDSFSIVAGYSDYRSKDAQSARDSTFEAGMYPLLESDFEMIRLMLQTDPSGRLWPGLDISHNDVKDLTLRTALLSDNDVAFVCRPLIVTDDIFVIVKIVDDFSQIQPILSGGSWLIQTGFIENIVGRNPHIAIVESREPYNKILLSITGDCRQSYRVLTADYIRRLVDYSYVKVDMRIVSSKGRVDDSSCEIDWGIL
jgi:hypothetical protein